MSFSAGEIIAYLKLDRSEFNRGLDEARADADEKFAKDIEVKVKPVLDKTAVDEVLAEERVLKKDITFKVKPTAAKGEAEATGQQVSADVMRGFAKAMGASGLSAEDMRLALGGWKISTSGLEGALSSGILASLKDVSFAPIQRALSASPILLALGMPLGEAIMAEVGQSIALGMGHTPAISMGGGSFVDAFAKELSNSMRAIKAADILPALGPAGKNLGEAMMAAVGESIALGPGATYLPPGFETIFSQALGQEMIRLTDEEAAKLQSGGGGGKGGADSALNKSFADFIRNYELSGGKNATTKGGWGFTGNPINKAFQDFFDSGGKGGTGGIQSALKAGGYTAKDIAAAIENTMKAAGQDAKKSGAGKKLFDSVFGFANKMYGGMSGGTGAMKLLMNPIGASAGVAFLGAFGAAISGGLAATIIGGAGTMAALLPGMLDLQKGMAAYTQLHTPGGSTKGMSASQIGLGKSLGGLIGAGSKGLGAAETQIMPQITKFVAALTKAIPLFNEFAKPAIAAMTGFFNAIDKGMGGGGFKSFMGSMSKLVGPIMTEFGKVLLNLGGALGGFLKLFGGVGAKQIGPWFVKITGELDKFLNKVKLGPGFVSGMVTVFSNLGKIFSAVWPTAVLLAKSLAPIGMQVFRIMGWMATWIARVVKLIPPNLVTGLLAVVIGMTGVFKAVHGVSKMLLLGQKAFKDIRAAGELARLGFGKIGKAGELLGKGFSLLFSPTGLIIIGVLLLAVAIYEVYKHWHTIWPKIKAVVEPIWKWMENDVIHPIVNFFTKTIPDALHSFEKLWDSVWNGIKGAVNTVWGIIKPIFDSIKTAISDITGGISSVVGAAGKVGSVVSGAMSVLNPVSDVKKVLGFLASGGPASAGSPYIVGEQGPELFVPSQSGTVVPNGAFSGGGNGRGQQIIFQIDARGHRDPQAVSSAVKLSIGATLPSLQAALARGAA